MKLFKKILFAFSLLTVTLSMQSCIEIVEEITVNEDQSGTLALSAGLNNANSIFALIGAFTDITFLDDIEREIEIIVSKLKAQQGISNVRFTKIKSGGNYALSFDFSDSKALNNALYAVNDQKKTFFQPSFYKITKNKYHRKNITNWANMLLEKEKDNLPDESVFDLITYKAVVHFPRQVKKVNADDVVISKDEKTVSISNFISDILDKRIDTGIKVRF
jgi:hypothetical protein